MRISIPEEIEKAARILAQRDRILAQANEEAARVVQMARERSDQLIDREALVQAAQSRAANIIEAARQEAEGVTTDADGYVLDRLGRLEQDLNKLLTVVRNGISEVNRKAVQNPVLDTRDDSQFAPPQIAPPVHQPVEVNARNARQ